MRLGSYEILDTIGRGGMAVVLRARSEDGTEVALKVLQPSEARDRLARFDRERRLLAALGEAEGFVPLLGAGDSPQGPYLVMPYVAGGTLRQRLEAGKLGVDETIELGRELATALGRAHALGIVHRDLKPENVLFTTSGRPLIADLGLAKHFDSVAGETGPAARSMSLSHRGELRGTPGYMPLEQMRDAKSVGPQADVFALGAILYECLTGQPAFHGEEFYQLLGKVERGVHAPLRRLRPETPRWLATIVERALAKDPRARFGDGTAVERALAAEGTDQARRVSLLLAGVVTVVAFVALAVALVLLLRAPAPPPPPPPPPAPTRREAARALVDAGARKLAKGDLEGARADLGRAIELDPESARAFILRSRARVASGDLGSARDDAERAVALAPKDSEAWAALGASKLGRIADPSAREDLDRALELDPRSALALALRSRAWGRARDWTRAHADAERAVALAPELAAAWAARGEARAERGDLPGGVADLDRALELDPGAARTHALRGTFRSRLGDLSGGLEDLTRATQIDPRDAGSWHDLGIVRRFRQEIDLAIEAASRAIELDPRLAAAWNNRGYCRLQKGDKEGAIFDYTRAIELDPNDATPIANRGAARAMSKDFAGADADFSKAIDLDPTDASTIRNRGMLRHQRGDHRAALADLERALRLKPDADDAATTRKAIEVIRRKLEEPRSP